MFEHVKLVYKLIACCRFDEENFRTVGLTASR